MYTEFLARRLRPCAQRTILGLSLFALSACSAADVSPNTPTTEKCEERSSQANELPTDVLVGTDIAELSHFEKSSAAMSGRYQAELGGANVSISVTVDSLTRTFQEPGTDPGQKTFQPVCISGSDLIADGIIARRVSDGLLYLEPSSSIGGIPADLWILLDAQQPTSTTTDVTQ